MRGRLRSSHPVMSDVPPHRGTHWVRSHHLGKSWSVDVVGNSFLAVFGVTTHHKQQWSRSTIGSALDCRSSGWGFESPWLRQRGTGVRAAYEPLKLLVLVRIQGPLLRRIEAPGVGGSNPTPSTLPISTETGNLSEAGLSPHPVQAGYTGAPQLATKL